ncbi:aspartyl protease family protein [Sphingomonas sanguinis]|uniref:aspartyl protease family protein n=1 Tax=Sphingomonas sp. LC-1 TaxID=3110957 RepID=UPI0021BB6CDA|nr:aspartyl protease family protein [Sphingomonas sp. LC-1]MCT8002497.1 aspartyl protease family protein [Sphingomonas sp. LC-1]
MRRPIYLLPIPLLLAAAVMAPLASHTDRPATAPEEDVVNAAARDPGVMTLAPDAEDRWIPFQLTPGNQIRFAMTIDGQSVTAILDTGVSFTLLSQSSPVAAKGRVRPGGQASAIGGAVAIGWMPTRTVALGGLSRKGGGVAVAPLPALATGDATAVDLLVGRDLLADHALDIDYAAKRFRLIASGRMPFTGATAPLVISPERRVYESVVGLGAARLSPVIVDTGDGSALTVTQAGWRAAKLNSLPTTTAIGFGLAGPSVNDLAIVPSVRLGTLTAHEVEVRIEPAQGFSESVGAAGRIGSGFLQRYRVLLDPGAGRMILSPGPHADDPALRSTVGLLLGVASDRLRVLHVMRGGPADKGGWREGDTICAIDGQPIPHDYVSSPMARWTVGKPGTMVTLRTCDGQDRKLTLARFY